jgi:hypothetical protein
MLQVRIHGRDGQAVVTAAELLSVAGFQQGRHAQAFPSFGSERTSAPVVAFCCIDDREMPATEMALKHLGRPLPNAVLLGGFAALSGLITHTFTYVYAALPPTGVSRCARPPLWVRGPPIPGRLGAQMSSRKIALAATAAAVAFIGAAVSTAAHAHSHARGADAQWSVTIGAPVITLPAPRIMLPVPAPVVVVPQPRVVYTTEHPRSYPVYGPGGYREPRRWDVDGDGIPNRHDRIYNPVWDRNGNGVPDRREYRHGPHGDRDRDGIPNRHDRRDDRWDDHRWDDHRRDNHRPGDRHRDWREPHSR